MVLFSQAPAELTATPPPTRRKDIKERQTLRNALRECMIDLFSVSLCLSGAACVSRVKEKLKLSLKKLQKLQICFFLYYLLKPKVDLVACLLKVFCDPEKKSWESSEQPEREHHFVSASTVDHKRTLLGFFFCHNCRGKLVSNICWVWTPISASS